MQMKALRSENFAKLSSSNSTRDVYWVTSISAGTPAGYCLSQMRSMVFPLRFTSSAAWDGTPRWAALVPGSIEQCGGRWQGARVRPAQGCSKKGRVRAAESRPQVRGAAVFWSVGLASLVVLLGLTEGLATAFGFAGLEAAATGFSAAFGALSGLALACRTAAVLPRDLASDLASLASAFGPAAASGFAASRVFFARCRD